MIDGGRVAHKDAVILSKLAFPWDWAWNNDDLMHHKPGYRNKDIDHFLSLEGINYTHVILSTGR